MLPAKRTGVYMRIPNTMIVAPMLIETVTLGWITKLAWEGTVWNRT